MGKDHHLSQSSGQILLYPIYPNIISPTLMFPEIRGFPFQNATFLGSGRVTSLNNLTRIILGFCWFARGYGIFMINSHSKHWKLMTIKSLIHGWRKHLKYHQQLTARCEAVNAPCWGWNTAKCRHKTIQHILRNTYSSYNLQQTQLQPPYQYGLYIITTACLQLLWQRACACAKACKSILQQPKDSG